MRFQVDDYGNQVYARIYFYLDQKDCFVYRAGSKLDMLPDGFLQNRSLDPSGSAEYTCSIAKQELEKTGMGMDQWIHAEGEAAKKCLDAWCKEKLAAYQVYRMSKEIEAQIPKN